MPVWLGINFRAEIGIESSSVWNVHQDFHVDKEENQPLGNGWYGSA